MLDRGDPLRPMKVEAPATGIRAAKPAIGYWFGWTLTWTGRAFALGGLLLAFYSLSGVAVINWRGSSGMEAVATIVAARRESQTILADGLLDLKWQDHRGEVRQEADVRITPQLAYKLRIGEQLSREAVRVRYQPATPDHAIVVVDDVPEMIRNLAILAIIGFLIMSFGSILVMFGLWLLGPMPSSASLPRQGLGHE